MRTAGNTSPCSNPTEYSPPLIHSSTSTGPVQRLASAYAAGNCSASVTLFMPTLEPSPAGLTISGRPSSATMSAASAGACITRQRGVPSPQAVNSCLLRNLSIDSAEPSTPLPVYGRLSVSSAPCMTPSSPPRPCNASQARSKPSPPSSSGAKPSAGSTRCASTPRRNRAASTASPLSSEISRSAESPPISTATRPKSAATSILVRLMTRSSRAAARAGAPRVHRCCRRRT